MRNRNQKALHQVALFRGFFILILFLFLSYIILSLATSVLAAQKDDLVEKKDEGQARLASLEASYVTLSQGLSARLAGSLGLVENKKGIEYIRREGLSTAFNDTNGF